MGGNESRGFALWQRHRQTDEVVLSRNGKGAQLSPSREDVPPGCQRNAGPSAFLHLQSAGRSRPLARRGDMGRAGLETAPVVTPDALAQCRAVVVCSGALRFSQIGTRIGTTGLKRRLPLSVRAGRDRLRRRPRRHCIPRKQKSRRPLLPLHRSSTEANAGRSRATDTARRRAETTPLWPKESPASSPPAGTATSIDCQGSSLRAFSGV